MFENIYLNANLNKEFIDTEIKISKNYSKITTPVKDDYFHALNAIHGLFTLKC